MLKESPLGEESIITINEVTSRPLPIEQASPLAIALYELLENAILHAFEESSPANYLQVTLAVEPAEIPDLRYRLTVQDSGLGIPANIDPQSAQTPGLRVVAAMAARLGGELTFSTRGGGTLASISFPAQDCP